MKKINQCILLVCLFASISCSKEVTLKQGYVYASTEENLALCTFLLRNNDFDKLGDLIRAGRCAQTTEGLRAVMVDAPLPAGKARVIVHGMTTPVWTKYNAIRQ